MYDKYLEIQLHWSVVIPSMPRFAKASAKAAVVPAAGPAPRSIADLVSQDPPAITAVDVIGRVCYVFGSQGRYPQCKFALRAATTASGTAGTSGETWPIAILVKCNGSPGRMPVLDDMVTLHGIRGDSCPHYLTILIRLHKSHPYFIAQVMLIIPIYIHWWVWIVW